MAAYPSDFSGYQNWQKITTPDGGVYYAVPNTEYVYDPFLSQAKGRPVLRPNPSRQIQAEKDAKAAGSLTNQLLPFGAAVAAPIVANKAVDYFFPSALEQAQTNLANAMAGQTTGAAGTSATSGQAFVQGASGNSLPVPEVVSLGRLPVLTEGTSGIGPVANGATYAEALGQTQPGGFGLGSGTYYGDILAPLAIAHGGYNLATSIGGNRDVAGGAMSGAEMGAGIGTLIMPGVGTAIGAGIGAIGGGLLGSIKSGRSKSHEERSNQRQFLKDNVPTFLDPKGNITLSNGQLFDIGKEREKGRKFYDEITKDVAPEVKGLAIGAAMPIGMIASGGNKQIATNFTGNIAAGFTQAGSTAEDFNREARNQYNRLGISEQQAYEQIAQMADKGVVSQDEVAAYHNAVNQAFHGPGSEQAAPAATAPAQAVVTTTGSQTPSVIQGSLAEERQAKEKSKLMQIDQQSTSRDPRRLGLELAQRQNMRNRRAGR